VNSCCRVFVIQTLKTCVHFLILFAFSRVGLIDLNASFRIWLRFHEFVPFYRLQMQVTDTGIRHSAFLCYLFSIISPRLFTLSNDYLVKLPSPSHVGLYRQQLTPQLAVARVQPRVSRRRIPNGTILNPYQ